MISQKDDDAHKQQTRSRAKPNVKQINEYKHIQYVEVFIMQWKKVRHRRHQQHELLSVIFFWFQSASTSKFL